MAKKYLDNTGLTYLWGKLKAYFQPKLVSGTNIKTINNQSVLGSGNISISGSGTVDTAMSDSSTNAVQNKIVKSYVDTEVGNIQTFLANIDSIDMLTCPANSSLAVPMANAQKAIVFGIGASNSKICALANAATTGGVTSLKVAGAANMTLTNSTNTLTITNGYGYVMQVLVIRFS